MYEFSKLWILSVQHHASSWPVVWHTSMIITLRLHVLQYCSCFCFGLVHLQFTVLAVLWSTGRPTRRDLAQGHIGSVHQNRWDEIGGAWGADCCFWATDFSVSFVSTFECQAIFGSCDFGGHKERDSLTNTIHAWYIYLHVPYIYHKKTTKCR